MLIIKSNDEMKRYLTCLPIPQMTSASQDWFIASTDSQHQAWTAPSWFWAFFVSTQWWTNYCWHSLQIWAWNRAYSQIELPISSAATYLEIWARKNESSNNLRPIRAFELLWSNDWTTFTSIFSQSNLWSSWSIWSVKHWTFTNTKRYKYYRLRMQAHQQYEAIDYWNIK